MSKYFILTLLVTLLVFGGWASAQEEDDPVIAIEFEITGEVSFSEDGELLVGGIVIAPAGAFNPSELEEGDIVTVTGIMLNDDTLQATSLTVEDDDDEDGEIEGDVIIEHPVGSALADEFDLDYDVVVGWHDDDSLGYGQIGAALLLAEELGEDPEAIIQRLLDGENPQQIARENGISPSALATGHVISRNNGNGNGSDDGETGFVNANGRVNVRSDPNGEVVGVLDPGTPLIILETNEDGWQLVQLPDGSEVWIVGNLVGAGNGNSGNTPGNSGNAPGNSGNAPGNSGNTPGNSGNAPGNSGNNGNGNGRGGR